MPGCLFAQSTQPVGKMAASSSRIYLIFDFAHNTGSQPEQIVSSESLEWDVQKSSVEFRSFADGYTLGAGIGIWLNKTYAIELYGEQFWGTNTIGSKNSINFGDARQHGSTTENSMSSSAFVLSPALAINLPEIMSGITPYIRLGALLGFPSITNKGKVIYSGQSGNEIVPFESEESGRIALGYRVDAGVRVLLSNTFSLTGALALSSLNWKPDKLTQSNRDQTYRDLVSDDDAHSLPGVLHNFSSIGFRIGLVISM